jgi:hypothetical protein
MGRGWPSQFFVDGGIKSNAAFVSPASVRHLRERRNALSVAEANIPSL